MTRREKFILAVTCGVAALGLGSLLFGGNPEVKAPSPAQDKALSAQIEALAKGVDAATPSPVEVAMLEAIQRPWKTDGLYDKGLVGKAQGPKPASLPKYTGYVELGTGRLAVVDGFEYQVGDALEGGGYKVVAITPEKIFLESLANGNRVEVPYEGQEDQVR
jgi:hypothetical protein